MKHLLFCLLLLPAGSQLRAQTAGNWIPESGKVHAYSVEGHHAAECPLDSARVDFKKQRLYCRIAVKEFSFGVLPVFARKVSVVQRFLSSYMEAERFPFIIYDGTITRVVPGITGMPDTLWTTGMLTAHGVTRKVTFPVIADQDHERLHIRGQLEVKAVDDFRIKAGTPIRYRYLNRIRVSFAAQMRPS